MAGSLTQNRRKQEFYFVHDSRCTPTMPPDFSSGSRYIFLQKLAFRRGLKFPKLMNLRKKVVHLYRSTRLPVTFSSSTLHPREPFLLLRAKFSYG